MVGSQLQHKLSFILALYAGLAVLVIGTLFSMVELYRQFDGETSRLEQTALALLESNEATVATAVHHLDPNVARNVVDGVTAYDYIVAATIFDESGAILAERKKSAATEFIWRPLGLENRVFSRDISVPGETERGRFNVEVDFEWALASFYERALITISAEFLKLLALALVIYIVGARKIARPLESLSDYLGDIDAGDHSKTLPPETEDPSEIGDLARSAQKYLTVNKQYYSEIESQRSEIEKILDTVVECVIATDAMGAIRFSNRAAEETFGFDASSLNGMTLDKLILGLSKDSPMAHLEQLSRESDRMKGVKKNGERFPIEISLGSYEIDGSRYYISTIRDNTEQEKLEQRLRQSQKMEAVGQLAGGIAHDFNNVLTVILGNMELAREAIKSRKLEKAIDYLNVAEEGSSRAAQFTRRLLIFSRRDITSPKVLNVADVIDSSVNLLKTIIPENIHLDIQIEEADTVRADFNQLQQALVNLIINARDALIDGGTISIELSNRQLDQAYTATHPEAMEGDYVLLSVSDNGAGIDPEIRDRIFEPFFTTKGPGKGTGLGLATVYSVITSWQGHVSIYSELGQGTTVRVYLPATDVEHDESRNEPGLADESFKLSGVVLVCEDDVDVRRLMVSLLESTGLEVIESLNPRDALRIAREGGDRIDLLITDVVMPEMNGRELAEQITQIHDMHVLFVSGYTTNIIVHHGVVEEDIHFLEKPFSRAKLLNTVREILEVE